MSSYLPLATPMFYGTHCEKMHQHRESYQRHSYEYITHQCHTRSSTNRRNSLWPSCIQRKRKVLLQP